MRLFIKQLTYFIATYRWKENIGSILLDKLSKTRKTLKVRITCISYLLLGLFSFVTMDAQLVITDATTAPYTPQNLVRNVFLGSGVEVTNVAFSGVPSAVGYFSGAEDRIGLDRGIVLSTSRVKGIAQPNNSSEDVGVDDLTGGPNFDQDLSIIATGPLEDVFSYGISFIPSADTLRFRYVFASEEYPQFVCDEFNDIFGFFITGPKPSGGSYNSENIALVPDPSDPSGLSFTDIPVSIDNIQDGSNGNCPPSFETFYNINPQGTTDFKYDGYTTVFTAEAIVTPCEEYTMKVAIADVGDDYFGSCVFLEAKSFGTGTLAVELNSLSADGSLAEGCGTGALEFSLPEIVDEDYVIDIDFINSSNAATSGIDYPEIPSQLVIPAGSKSISVHLEAYVDSESEGDELISFEIQVDLCNRKRFEIIIRDDELFDPILPEDVSICEGESYLIGSALNPNFILPPDPYFENVGAIDISPEMEAIYSDIIVSGVLPTILTPDVIERVCIIGLEHTYLDDLDIYLVAPGGQFLELSTDNGFKLNNAADIDRFDNTCFTPLATTNINNGNNLVGDIFADNLTYTGDFKPEGVWSDLWDGQNPTNGTWRLLLIDDTNGFKGVLEGWSMTFKSFYSLDYEWSSNPPSDFCQNCKDIEVSPEENTEYTLKIIDSYGCERSESMNVYVTDGIERPVANCTRMSENSIEITWSQVDGSSGYEVRLNGGNWIPVGVDLTYDFTGLASNTDFLIEVRAFNSDCYSESTKTECRTDDCAKPTLFFSIDQEVSCPGGADGEATILATGNAPFTYVLNGMMNSTGVFQNLVSGLNSATVSDATGCTESIDFMMPAPEAFNFIPEYRLSDPCNVVSNITASFEISGGNPPYSYLWSNLTTSEEASNLSPGPYFLTITDDNGCTGVGTLQIPSLDQFVYTIETTPPLCKGQGDGTAEVIEVSGNGPYTYEWEDGSSQAVNKQLEAGFYVVTVVDNLGCSVPMTFSILEGAELDLEINTTDASCAGQESGAASVQVSGGSEPYAYFWNLESSNSPIAEDLLPGNYTLSVTDSNNCMASQSFEIKEPDPPLLANISDPDTICSGNNSGRLAVVPSGGSEPYSIEWSNSLDSKEIQGLSAGVYMVTVTDSQECKVTATSSVVMKKEIRLQISQVPSSCFKTDDGSANVESVFYGNQEADLEEFEISWNTAENQNGPMANMLVGGDTYIATVTDRYGCRASQEVEIGSPDLIGAEIISLRNVSCFGEADGALKILGTGGSGNYSYLWDVNANLSTADSVSQLRKGTYAVTVTDEKGCSGFDLFGIEEPRPLSMDFRVIDVSCFGGSDGRAEAVVQGGEGPYSFAWTNNENGMAIENAISEQYNVTVTDANGCVLVDSTKIEEPEQGLMVEVEIQDVSCFGKSNGQVEINASGGSAYYRYSLDGFEFASSGKFTNLAAGNYTAYVSDYKGCTDSFPEILVFEPAELKVDLGDDLVIPFGETSTLNPSIQNARGTISFQWKSSSLGLLSCLNCLNPVFTGEKEASYELSIIDEKGCVASDFLTIRLENYSVLFVPTAFTPNGDQENDVLRVFGANITKVEMFRIYNRWGSLVFEVTDAQLGDSTLEWDGVFKGDLAPSGLYYWFADVVFQNGFIDSFNGNTTLLR